MLDAIIAFGSAFMLSQTYFGANSVEGISKLVEYASVSRYQSESITTTGQCLSGLQVVPCHLILAGCKVRCLLDWIVLYPIFFGMSLLSVVCVGVVTDHREEEEEEAENVPHRYFKEFADFTTFLLGVSSIVGLVASGVGLALLFAPMSGPRVWQQPHISVGWAEIVTIGLTVCQMMLTLGSYNQCRRDLARREGAIVLVSAAEAIEESKPFLEKTEAGLVAEANELALRHVLYA